MALDCDKKKKTKSQQVRQTRVGWSAWGIQRLDKGQDEEEEEEEEKVEEKEEEEEDYCLVHSEVVVISHVGSLAGALYSHQWCS